MLQYSSEWDNIYDYIDSLDIPSQEGNKNMDKKFHIMPTNGFRYKTYEEAEAEAKRYTARNDQPYAIVQAVSMTKEIVPEIEVVKL